MRTPDEIRLPNFADQECPHGNLPEDKNPSCSCWDNLQCRLDTLRAGRAPLPMNAGEAIKHAIRLRSGGMPYATISLVMAVYHGQFYSAGRWRRACHERNAQPIARRLEETAAES